MSSRYRRPATPDAKTRAGAARADRLQAQHDRLAEQVAALRTGDDWQRWLATAARFHTYSFQNTLLILAQRPDATIVAGYEAWKAIGRHVGKGEKGIAILAPVFTRRRQSEADDPEATSSAAPGPDDPPAAATRLAGFRVTYVWDVAQTDGRPLPEQPAPQLLRGMAPGGMWDALAELVEASGYSLDRGPCGEANGVTVPDTRSVRVRADIDDAQAAKTLAHELAHVRLHTTGTDDADDAAPAFVCRGTVEVEAESVAYLVAAAHGLDSSSYSFPYVTHWADAVHGQRPEDVVRATGERVLVAASWILAATQPHMTEDAATERLDALADRADASLRSTSLLRTRAENTLDRTTSSPVGAPRPAADSRAHGRTATSRGTVAGAATGRRGPASITTAPSAGRAELVAVHRLAVAFYRDRLDGSWVPDYLDQRGLGAALDDPWAAGYAPDGWTYLVDHLRENGVDDGVLLASGLATTARTGNLIDRFRDRLVLPIRDPAGDVVAFIGRAHPGSDPDRTPKYLNSPQTAIYHKGEILYGLHETRTALARGARPAIVEGPLDAIAVTAGTGGRCAGLAACGTALTAAHVDTLCHAVDVRSRGVVVATDPDAAGLAAAEAALGLFSRRNISPSSAQLTGGMDPADLLRVGGEASLTAALLDQSQPLADQVVDARIAAWGDHLQSVEGRVGAVRAVAPLVASLPVDDIGRQAARVAAQLDLDITLVQREIAPFIGLDHPATPHPRDSRAPARGGGPAAASARTPACRPTTVRSTRRSR
jgi:DNA primase